MATITPELTTEQRLAALEAAVAEIRVQLTVTPPAPSWLDQISGIMGDDPAFEQMIAYGREFRKADRILSEEMP